MTTSSKRGERVGSKPLLVVSYELYMLVHEGRQVALIQPNQYTSQEEMWLVVLCFVLPAVVFSLFALLAWLRVLHLNHKRKKRANTRKEANEKLITKRNGEVICNIPIQVIDVDTGATYTYSSSDSLSGNQKPKGDRRSFPDPSIVIHRMENENDI